MADELAEWVAENRAKAKAYDVLTEALRAALKEPQSWTVSCIAPNLERALEAAERVRRADLRKSANTLESQGNPKG